MNNKQYNKIKIIKRLNNIINDIVEKPKGWNLDFLKSLKEFCLKDYTLKQDLSKEDLLKVLYILSDNNIITYDEEEYFESFLNTNKRYYDKWTQADILRNMSVEEIIKIKKENENER